MASLHVLLSLFVFVCVIQCDLVPGYRPPAYPLVVRSPYLSIWSVNDLLFQNDTQFWDGRVNSLHAYIRVDGATYRLMGRGEQDLDSMTLLPTQQSAQVYPTRTVYTFNVNSIVQVELTFTTPLLTDDYDVLSLPVTYMTYSVSSLDKKSHSIQIYQDVGAELSIQNKKEEIEWEQFTLNHASSSQAAAYLDCQSVGTLQQPILKTSGDRVSIDWGYAYVCAPTSEAGHTYSSTIASGITSRRYFVTNGTLPKYDNLQPRPFEAGYISLSSVYSFQVSSNGVQTVHWTLAYDQIFSINYYNHDLQPFWRRGGTTFQQMLIRAESQYQSLNTKCATFDKNLVTNLTNTLGAQYATLAASAYRQSLASSELVWHPEGTGGEAWYMLKEISSDGDLCTVDVIFPACPLLFILNPELVKKQIIPVLHYANNQTDVLYTYPFAPHHLGFFPIGWVLPWQQENMPVEETGNLLLMTAAITTLSNGETAWFYPKYWPLFERWGRYLVNHLPDPGNQLCTDDFEGPSPHNVNLAAKGIIALGAFSQLCDFIGDFDQANEYMSIARNYSSQWQTMAYTTNGTNDSPHYKKQYNLEDSWSLKYNLLWDRLLKLNLFPQSVFDDELNFYFTQMMQYGAPLNDGVTYTKLDWLGWVAAMSYNSTQTNQLLSTLYTWANQTQSRVPMTDWYDAGSGLSSGGFQDRAVVGGLYAPMMLKQMLAHI